MLKRFFLLTAAGIFLIGAACRTQTPAGFIRVEGTQFIRDGNPYAYLGTNVWFGANLGSPGAGGDRERLIRELDLLHSLGINNLRVLGASEGVTQRNTVRPPIQPHPGHYDEEVLQGLDFLLAEMAKRRMVAVIFLNNYWVWSGGMAQYISWIKETPVPNPFYEEYSWTRFMEFSAGFYYSEEANALYRAYIKTLLNRINTVNGVRYRDDPTIMSWQLANEPRPGVGESGKKNFEVFRKWIRETSDYIRSLDPNHLISTGNEGTAGSLYSRELYQEIHQFPNIDYMTFHLWLLNWSWYDPLNPEATYPEGERKALHYIQEHIGYAESMNKPLVLEEFGIPRDGHSFSPDASTAYRDRYYTTVFDAILQNAKEGGPLVGSNFWAWGGYGRVRDPDNPDWLPGDDYTGDPTQEPQGRNSIFATDSTTLKILDRFAHEMEDLK
jgi:mannan endo-1,4-beta-mannosidase